jgi:SHS2 domain-containing protein
MSTRMRDSGAGPRKEEPSQGEGRLGESSYGFTFLEHTADVGIHAWGRSVAEAFEQAAIGLVTLMGRIAEGPGPSRPIEVESLDVESLLVAFLNELVYLGETLDHEGVASVHVKYLDATTLRADVGLAPARVGGEGALVKAATYHALEVSERSDGSTDARVYLDV